MKKSEIEEELMSKIKIELDTLFYMPGEKIKGIIKIYPGIKIEIKNNILNLKLKLLQYEFWDYTNIQTDELKNIHKTEVSSSNIKYELKEEEKPSFKDNEEFGNFSLVLIEKEDKDKFISIPFEFELDKNNDKLLPTFQYEKDKYILGIRHILTVECEEYNSVNYIGLFIGKQPKNNLCESKKINYKIKTFFDDVDLEIFFKKQAFHFGEEINFGLKAHFKFTFDSGGISLREIIYRKINWIGYMKNSLLDKKIYIDTKRICQKKETKKNDYENDDEIEYLGEIIFNMLEPFQFAFAGAGIGAVSGTIIGGIICPHLLIGMLSGGILSYCIGTFGGIASYFIYHDYSPGERTPVGNFKSNSIKEKNNINNEKIKEELQKFVYFKDNKIIGFIKFKNNITPPVNGYYFKCDFTLKLDIKIPNIIKDTSKNVLKNEIDFYDGNEYIENMKKLLNINNILHGNS